MRFTETLPKVSVIMITYMHEEFIEQAVNGILMQQCDFEIELIIADDKSPDNTEAVIRKIQRDHARGSCIRYEKHSKNKGMMPNFCWAISEAKGKFIALCEGDDYWVDPMKLQKQIDFLVDNPDYNFSMGRVDYYYQWNGKSRKKNGPSSLKKKNGCYTIKDYIKSPFSQTSSFVFRNDLEVFPDWFYDVHAGDKSLVVIKTGLTGKIKYHEDLFSIYRVSKNNISHTASYNVFSRFGTTLDHWEAYLNNNYGLIFSIIRFKYKRISEVNGKNVFVRVYVAGMGRLLNLLLKLL